MKINHINMEGCHFSDEGFSPEKEPFSYLNTALQGKAIYGISFENHY